MGFQVLSVKLVVDFEAVVDLTELYFLLRTQEQIFLLFPLATIQQILEVFLRVVRPLKLFDLSF